MDKYVKQTIKKRDQTEKGQEATAWNFVHKRSEHWHRKMIR